MLWTKLHTKCLITPCTLHIVCKLHSVCKIHGPFSCSIKKILHLTEKIYTGTACGACDKYAVWMCIKVLEYYQSISLVICWRWQPGKLRNVEWGGETQALHWPYTIKWSGRVSGVLHSSSVMLTVHRLPIIRLYGVTTLRRGWFQTLVDHEKGVQYCNVRAVSYSFTVSYIFINFHKCM